MIISFDFDGTLENEFGSLIENTQKHEIQSLAKKYLEEGHDVRILTRRYDYNNRHKGKGNEYEEVFEMAKKLGIEKIHFTNREYKYSHIIDLNIDVHFENDEYEVSLISENKNCKVIHVESSNWREYDFI